MTQRELQTDIDRIEKIVSGYMEDVTSDKIPSCRWVKLAVKRHADDLENGHLRGLIFRKERAYHAVKFFSFLKLWKGREYKGKEFILAPHRVFYTWVLMGWYKIDGTRRFRMAYDEEARKGAKAEWIENEIPTVNGFKRMADIHPGDYVFGSSGDPVMVVGETEIMHNKKCMAVSFSTGERIVVSEDHLWKVNRRSEPESIHRQWKIEEDNLIREEYPISGASAVHDILPHRSYYSIAKRAEYLNVKKLRRGTKGSIRGNMDLSMPDPPSVLTTKTIAKTLRYGKRNDLRYSVDVSPAIKTSPVDLPVQPYTLGAWLGDGNSADARITVGYNDIEIVDRIKHDGLFIDERKSSNKNSGIFQIYANGGSSVRRKLKELRVLGNKHIPSIYLRADMRQRIELLQGLMDTDGTVDRRGHCAFDNCNKNLINDFFELVSSLGIKSTIKKKNAMLNGICIGDTYRVSFVPPFGIDIFGLKRKQERIAGRVKKTRSDIRSITGVDAVSSVPVKCISVNSPDGIYLTGKSFIPTHNSTYAGGLGAYFFVADGEEGAEVYTAAVKKEQARIVWVNIKNLLKESGFSKKVNFYTHHLAVENTNSKCEPLSSDTKSLDGLDTHFASEDELHAHPTREVHDLIVDSIGARSQPLVLMITTAGFNQTGICYEIRDYLTQILKGTVQDDSFFGMIFTLDTKKDWPDLKAANEMEGADSGAIQEDDWTDEDIWVKAAPGLVGVTLSGKRFGIDEKGNTIPGYMTKIDDMRNKCRIAKEIPSAQNNFLTKRLNIWTQQENRWIDLTLWDQNNIRPVTDNTCLNRVCYGGIDLSAVSDLTVWTMLFPDAEDRNIVDILIRVWCPEARLFDTKNKYRAQYQSWKKQGYLITTEGDAMDYDFVRSQIVSDNSKFNIHSIAVDRGFQGYEFSQKLDRELGGNEKVPKVVACGMGWVSMMGPCQEFERRLFIRKLNHGGNPILRWMADNVSVKINPTGGGKSPNKATSQGKIDGIVGILLGLDRLLRNPEDNTKSAYETPGAEIMVW